MLPDELLASGPNRSLASRHLAAASSRLTDRIPSPSRATDGVSPLVPRGASSAGIDCGRRRRLESSFNRRRGVGAGLTDHTLEGHRFDGLGTDPKGSLALDATPGLGNHLLKLAEIRAPCRFLIPIAAALRGLAGPRGPTSLPYRGPASAGAGSSTP